MQTDYILKLQEFVDRLREAKSEGEESWIVEMSPVDEENRRKRCSTLFYHHIYPTNSSSPCPHYFHLMPPNSFLHPVTKDEWPTFMSRAALLLVFQMSFLLTNLRITFKNSLFLHQNF